MYGQSQFTGASFGFVWIVFMPGARRLGGLNTVYSRSKQTCQVFHHPLNHSACRPFKSTGLDLCAQAVRWMLTKIHSFGSSFTWSSECLRAQPRAGLCASILNQNTCMPFKSLGLVCARVLSGTFCKSFRSRSDLCAQKVSGNQERWYALQGIQAS